LQRLEKEVAKADAKQRAVLAVRQYENTVELLTSVHRDCGEPIDWRAVAASPEPDVPLMSDQHTRSALEALSGYAPGFLARLFGRHKKRVADMELDVEVARQMDRDAFERSMKACESDVAGWRAEVEMARGVLRGEPEAFGRAAQELKRYDELGEWGVAVSVTVGHSDKMGVTLTIPPDDFVPDKKRTLTSTGKLSERALPKGVRGEIYQDFVCGAVLRAVRESFALFPVDYVVATAIARLLDSSTGHLEDRPIVSIICPRVTVDELNLDAADASDALANFKSRMTFRKTKGFAPVEAFSLDDAPAA